MPEMRTWTRRRALGLTGAGLALGALRRPDTRARAQPSAQGRLYFPPTSSGEWERVEPREAGWDAAGLAAVMAYAAERDSTAMVLLWRGRILAESYWQGWSPAATNLVLSVQKSLTSFLVGIAVSEGAIAAIDEPVSTWLDAGWSQASRAQEAAITLKHLLTMTSGLDDDIAFVAPAGARWLYTTVPYYQIKNVLERATGESIVAYTSSRLWNPIGARDSLWLGNVIGAPPGHQWHTSARDMARFGLLVQAGGAWDGAAPLVAGSYLDASLSPSQDLNPAYGYLWWLNSAGRHLLPGDTGSGTATPLIPAAPRDTVAALGMGDRRIYVTPSLQLVVARHGGSASGPPDMGSLTFDNELWRRLMQAAPR